MTLQLHPEQQQVVDDVSAAFRAGHKRVMVSAFCGFGKTELATAMLKAAHANGKRGAFLADRRALVTQTSERFDKYGLEHGIIMADNPRFRPSLQIQVCSIATLIRRRWPEVNVLFVDEAHILSDAVKKKLAMKDCYAVGLSATPITKGLGKHFDVVVNGPPANKLIEMGRLVPLVIHSFAQPDREGMTVSGGEFAGAESEKRVLQVVGDVVDKYLQDGDGAKFICFAWSIAHAEELTRQFLAAGINCVTYTSNDDPEDRHESIQEFKKSNSAIRGLISVAALTRGFDQTDIELLIDARPLRNALHEYVQMLGRLMRSHPGKTHGRVFDHSGNAVAFWHQWQELFENGVLALDDGKKKEKPKPDEKKPVEPVKCPTCSRLHNPAPFCPHCGHQYPKKKAVEHVPGTLKELIAGKYTKQLTSTLWPQVAGYVLERREGEAAKKQALAIYKSITGEFPKGAWWETTVPVPPSLEVRSRIKASQIAFANRRQAGLPGTGASA